jgi:hypothetical protein
MRNTRPTTEERNQIINEMKEFHKNTFSLLKVDSSKSFYPKATFNWKDGLYVSLYERELTASSFYTEFVDDFYNPKDSVKRKIYVWKGNKEHINEYYKKDEATYSRWFVPADEFEEINVTSIALKSQTGGLSTKSLSEKPKAAKVSVESLPPFELDDDDTEEKDAPMSKMTIKDQCAIQWKMPVSDKKWLNNLINQVNSKSKK